MAELLMLRLDGVLQSWGEDAKWNKRMTSPFPSKSALVGMISCAMGLERQDPHIVELSEKISLGIRMERKGGMLTDFHTVQGMPDLFTAEGKKRANNTLVTYRSYLNDASFLVVVQAEPECLHTIAEALMNPKWPVYLGRKNCVPSRPVFDGLHTEYSSILDAIKRYPCVERHDDTREYEVDQSDYDGSGFSRNDERIGPREFTRRVVWRGVLKGE